MSSKFFTDNGFLTNEGVKVTEPFVCGMMDMFDSKEIKDMSVDELRALNASLLKLVSDCMNKAIVKKSKG